MDDDLQVAVDRALQAPAPTPDKVLQYVYSPNLDPTSSAFETQPAPSKPEAAASDGKKTAPKTMADLINATLRDEMRRDERIVIFGEDVADCSREEYLKQKLVKGKGGVFKLTAGIADRVRVRPGLQLSYRRSQHRGPRHGHGPARTEAGGRDPVL